MPKQLEDRNFRVKIVLEKVHSNIQLSKEAQSTMNIFAARLIENIMKKIPSVKQVSEHNIKDAVKATVDGELLTHSLQEIDRNNEPNLSKALVEHHMRRFAKRLTKKSINALTMFVEYIFAEILQLSGDFTLYNKSKRITPTYITTAISADIELSRLYNTLGFSNKHRVRIVKDGKLYKTDPKISAEAINYKEPTGKLFPDSVRRLAHKAGISQMEQKFVSRGVEIIKQFLSKVVSLSVSGRKVRLSSTDVQNTLASIGRPSPVIFTKKVSRVMDSGIKRVVADELKYNKCKTKYITSSGNKKYKFNPGTVARRKVRFYNNQDQCYIIGKSTMKKLITSTISLYKSQYQVSKGAVDLIHYAVEKYAVDVFYKALVMTTSRKAVRTSVEDLNYALQICNV